MLKLKKAIAFLLTFVMVFSYMPVSMTENTGDQVTDTVQNKDVVLMPKETEEEPETEPEGEPVRAELIALSPEDLSVSQLSDQRLEELKNQIPAETPKRGASMLRNAKGAKGAAPQPVTNTFTGFAAFEITPNHTEEAEQYDVDVQLSSPIVLLDEENAVIDNVTFALYHFHTDEEDNVQVETITADNGLEVDCKDARVSGFSFSTSDFSEFVLKYTVVFHYEDKTYACELPGAKDIPLAEILTALEITDNENIETFLADVAGVETSDDKVISLADGRDGRSFRILKESEIPVTLTVSMTNGQKYVLTVSATGNTELATEDNSTVISTVNDYYLPEEAAVYAETLTGEQNDAAISSVQNLTADKADEDEEEKSAYQAFSISLTNVDEKDYEGFDINVTLPEELSGKDFRLYQVQDGEATDITDTLKTEGETKEDGSQNISCFSFTTDTFADYVLCYTLVTYYTTASGDTYKITLNYGPEAGIPDGAELKVSEILEGEAYDRYIEDSAEKLGVTGEDITFARFFDIEIWAEEQKIEPKAPVQVTIAYQVALKLNFNSQISIVHFDDDGLEVIKNVTVSDDCTELSYEQGSFSVTGTIITTVPEQGEDYALIIKYDNNYYSVMNDGSLAEVNYSPAENTVEMDYPIFWNYTTQTVTNDGEEGTYQNIRIPSFAAGFDSQSLPEMYYYRYIDPDESSCKAEEAIVEGGVYVWETEYFTKLAIKDRINKQHAQYVRNCNITYSEHKIRGTEFYLGIDKENNRICGRVSEDKAAEIYLAKVTKVPSSANLNHTVNHIDISIKGHAEVGIPLAYGEYYYYVDGQRRTLTVSRGNDVTLKLKTDSVPIDVEDMKNAQVTAFSS